VRALLLRKTAPKGALRFAVETLTTDPRSVSRWLSGQSNAAQDGASADLHIGAPGLWSSTKGEPTLTSGEPLSDGRLPVALLGHIAGAIETGFHKGSWRTPSASDARWLRFLATCGYTLAEVEQRIVDAIDARTGDHDTEPDPITDEVPADD
jgi:ParB family chromosome partitioning protein